MSQNNAYSGYRGMMPVNIGHTAQPVVTPEDSEIYHGKNHRIG